MWAAAQYWMIDLLTLDTLRCRLFFTLQGETWTASQSVSHGGALPYNWMIENTIAAATPGSREPQPGQFLQMFRTDPVCGLASSCRLLLPFLYLIP